MRALTLSLALGLLIGFMSPAVAGDCSYGHQKTADSKSSTVAESQTPQTPKPDSGS